MIFSIQPARFCWKLSCLPTSKILTTPYTAGAAQPKSKPSSTKETTQHTAGNKKKKVRFNAINTKTSIFPDIGFASSNNHEDLQNKNTAISNSYWKWGKIEIDPTQLHKYCLMLSKIRLTSLVVITAMGGYAIAPGPFDLTTFLSCSIGTGLVSASANAVNQSMEVSFDAQMARTKNRVLVRGLLAQEHAITFAAISGVTGLSLLAFQVNSLTAILGGANLILYTSIYTPMKRITILNTWIGSVVGAVPPLMGWAACVGSIADPGAWIMSGILYAWQFPHFNALSWNLRPDYSKAGYRMMAVNNPVLCRQTSFNYTVALTGLSYIAPLLDVTNWWFALVSTPLNAYFLYLAWEFKKQGDAKTSRRLFRFSLLHLPILMMLMLVSKKYWFLGTGKADYSKLTEVEEKDQIIDRISKFIQPTPVG